MGITLRRYAESALFLCGGVAGSLVCVGFHVLGWDLLIPTGAFCGVGFGVGLAWLLRWQQIEKRADAVAFNLYGVAPAHRWARLQVMSQNDPDLYEEVLRQLNAMHDSYFLQDVGKSSGRSEYRPEVASFRDGA